VNKKHKSQKGNSIQKESKSSTNTKN